MKKVIILVSGNGGNLKFINEYIKHTKLTVFEIVAVVSDRECQALNYSRSNGIYSYCITYKRENPQELQRILEKYEADIIITNWHKIIDSETVIKYKNKMINLHYSLLPSFGGLIGDWPIKKALEKKCKYIGTTVHYVDEYVDNGLIIGQTILEVYGISEFSIIMNKIFKDGAMNLLNCIFILCNYTLDKYSYEIIISPRLQFDVSILNHDFWLRLKNA